MTRLCHLSFVQNIVLLGIFLFHNVGLCPHRGYQAERHIKTFERISSAPILCMDCPTGMVTLIYRLLYMQLNAFIHITRCTYTYQQAHIHIHIYTHLNLSKHTYRHILKNNHTYLSANHTNDILSVQTGLYNKLISTSLPCNDLKCLLKLTLSIKLHLLLTLNV